MNTKLEVVVFVYLRLVSDVDHQRAGSVTLTYFGSQKKKSRYDPQLFCNETPPGRETRNESEMMICDCDNDNEKEIDTDEGNAFEGTCIKCALF